jgi:hypothetical protein
MVHPSERSRAYMASTMVSRNFGIFSLYPFAVNSKPVLVGFSVYVRPAKRGT